MATPATRLVQDRNLDIHPGGAPLGGKTDVFKAAKKSVSSGRKALNDISNSGKPSALQASGKHNSTNVTAGNDFGSSKTALAVGGRGHFPKALEKGQVGGRKALGDLTNSVKPSLQHPSKKGQDKKLNSNEEETIPSAIKEEQYLHNHQECVKLQRKPMNFRYFLETVGLEIGSPPMLPQPPKLKPENPVKCLEIEEDITVLLNENRCRAAEFPGCSSSACRSPKPVRPSYENWKDEKFDFKLIDTPKLQKK